MEWLDKGAPDLEGRLGSLKGLCKACICTEQKNLKIAD